MSGALKGAAEDNVLSLLVWNERHAMTLASVLDPDLFDSRMYQKVAKLAIDYITKFSVPPREHIRDLMEAEVRHPTEGPYFVKLLNDTQALHKTLQPDYVMDTLDTFIRLKTKRKALEEAQAALSQGDEAKAEELLWQPTAFRPNLTAGTWLHDDNLDFMTTETSDEFSSGIDVLDERGVRPERRTLTLMIGPKKSGKSWWCINLGKAALKRGHTTLHLTLENSERLTKRRYLQAFFGMTKRRAQAVSTSSFEKDADGHLVKFSRQTIDAMPLHIDNRVEIVQRIRTLRLRARLLIKEWPTGMMTIPQLNEYLDMLERNDNFKPDLLIVDMPSNFKISGQYRREELGVVVQLLRGIGVARNIAVCAPTQGNRHTEGATYVSSRDIAEDYSMVGTADTVLTFNQTREERERGLARIIVDAARDAEDKFVVLISQQYATGQFALDSVYMDKVAESKLDSVTHGEELDTEELEEARHGAT
jgi:hypothetical protein